MSATHIAADIPPNIDHRVATYREVGGHSLRMLSFHAADAAGSPRPGIIWFHGGGWRKGDPESFAPLCLAAVERGMVALAPQYRLIDTHTQSVFDCMNDARAACDWAIRHAVELGIDPQRLVIAGSSAGGHLAASLATHHDDRLAAALVLLNPVLDCTERGYGHKLMNGRGIDASPIHRIRPGLPPTFILHGDADQTVPYENSVRFHRLMREAGNECDLVTVPGADHGLWRNAFELVTREVNAFLARRGFITEAG